MCENIYLICNTGLCIAHTAGLPNVSFSSFSTGRAFEILYGTMGQALDSTPDNYLLFLSLGTRDWRTFPRAYQIPPELHRRFLKLVPLRCTFRTKKRFKIYPRIFQFLVFWSNLYARTACLRPLQVVSAWLWVWKRHQSPKRHSNVPITRLTHNSL